MKPDISLAVVFIGHILGYFYFQTPKSLEKMEDGALWRHCLLYSVGIGIAFLLCIHNLQAIIHLSAQCAILHIVVECILRKWATSRATWIKEHSFIMDQITHCVFLMVIWMVNRNTIIVRYYITQKISYLSTLPITVLLGWLCVLRPGNMLITSSKTWQKYKDNTVTLGTGVENAGKFIGYLERTIVYVFLMYKQFSAIAFILTAKSVARFKEIENDQARAEYYLIGTLMSVAITLLISVLLGICGSST